MTVHTPELACLGPETTYYNYHASIQDQRNAKSLMSVGLKNLKELDWQVTGTIRAGDPLEQILKYTIEVSADALVITGHNTFSWIDFNYKNSLIERLIGNSRCSVLIAKSTF